MKTLTVKVDETVYEKLLPLLNSLPKEKIKIFYEIDDTHIPFMTEEEQKEIEEILKDPETRLIAKSKTIKYEHQNSL